MIVNEQGSGNATGANAPAPSDSERARVMKIARKYNQDNGRCGYPCYESKTCMWCEGLGNLLATAVREAREAALEQAAKFVEEQRQGGNMENAVQVFDVLGQHIRSLKASDNAKG